MMWRIAILMAVATALVGCRTDPNVPILERELRLQEDKIYQLEDELAQHRAALAAARQQTAPDKPGLGKSAPGRSAPNGLGSPPPAPPEVTGPALTPTNPADAIVPQPPIVELPTGPPQSDMPESLRSPKGASQPKKPETPQSPKDGSLPKIPESLRVPNDGPPDLERSKAAPDKSAPSTRPMQPSASSGRTWHKASATAQSETLPAEPAGPVGPVHRVQLNQALTGGWNADGKPGDEGLALFIEPQDSQGRSITRPAAVSIVVLDRQAAGDAARVARWDFTREQVAQRMRRTSVGSGIYLELPWPAQAPAHSDLQVFVRYAADESRQFEVDLPLGIELPGQLRQWTAAPPGTKRTVAAEPPRAPDPKKAVAATPPPVADKPVVAAAPAPVAEPPAATPAPAAPVRPARERHRSEVRRPVWSPNR